MTQILSIARKELRGYFVSPVALIFLATFLAVVLFSFFWIEPFFRRNIADVRPLFHWLPVWLIFLVAALTMRLWSEEQRMGTLELLLTLPVKVHRLVLGKFLAGLALVAVALALTLGLPLTVSMLGKLDWGPVIGGYLGALMLAGAYLAIGLCISASTSNPIVALLGMVAAGGALYLVGSDAVVSFAGNRVAEVLHAIGSGSRFESVQRGVLDLRDILYYGSVCVAFLYLNTVILEAKRWSQGAQTAPRRSAIKLSVALVLANLLVLNVAFASVRGARVDMTENREYSISPVTKHLLQGLDAPLLIRGYFSEKTHPLLAPLVPRIRDLIAEYGAVGGDKVTTEIVDPQRDPAVEKEANEEYGIKSIPFQFADRHEAAVVNSYFNILIKYGDKHETLGFDDLIEISVSGFKDIEVKLRNLEYDLTRAIKKAVYGFQPLEELFARAPAPITLTAYITSATVPDKLRSLSQSLEKVSKELADRSAGKFQLKVVDPSGDAQKGLREQLARDYGFKPFATSLLGPDSFYFHMLLGMGDRRERLIPSPEMGEAELRNELTSALKRLTPGFLKTVGLVTPEGPMPNRSPYGQPPSENEARFEMLKQQLSQDYQVRGVTLKAGRVPGDVDVLLVIGQDNLDEKERFAVDQHLMRGGALVVGLGSYALQPAGPMGGGLAVKKNQRTVVDMISNWGVDVEPKMVLDRQNEAFPVPVERNLMGLTVREIQLINYPFWVDIRSSGMDEGNPVVGGLPSVTLQWASPLKVSAKDGVTYTSLLRSTGHAWTQDDLNVQPDFGRYPKAGFGHDDQTKEESQILAVTAIGQFASTFKGKPSPLAAPAGEKKPGTPDISSAGGVIEQSPKTARLAVVGSSDFVSDLVLSISRQTGSGRFTNNLQFAQNLVDWSVEDVDLLSIRSRGTFARTLKPLEESARSAWEATNGIFVVVSLATVIGVAVMRRKRLQPIDLTSASVKERGHDKA